MTTERKWPDDKLKKFTDSQLSAESTLVIEQTCYSIFKGIKKSFLLLFLSYNHALCIRASAIQWLYLCFSTFYNIDFFFFSF